MTDSASFLRDTFARTREHFQEERTLLSFSEYLEVVEEDPVRQARDAACFLRDCFLHYGTEKISRPFGTFTRYKLFDCEFDGGRDPLLGHERVQQSVFGQLSDFVQDGRVNKLILLYGPNGSAKSSFISCLIRAMEHYSRQPEGALYTFNWVFPSTRVEKGGIGFASTDTPADLETFAHLPNDAIDARVRIETRDHPLLLLPRAERVAFLRSHIPEGPLPDALTEGELSAKSRAIYEALLKANQGDLGEVLKHVQVERLYISHRYRQGAVTVDPQMRVDAGIRQVTADKSLASLPKSLSNVVLYEPMGDLVDANRGLIEYNDLLKRPIEAFKYLLATCEKGTASLETVTLYLDAVFIASSNASHLDAFKEIPDFASFKARIELIQVPYLIDFETERAIYSQLLDQTHVRRPKAPHLESVAALWAVLTRLMRPEADGISEGAKAALDALTPLQKAELYSRGRLPEGLARDVANEVRALIPRLYRARQSSQVFEGRVGASPRELRAALLAAARRPGHRCLSPLALFDELKELCTQVSVYQFLRIEPDRGYHDPRAFVGVVHDWYMELVEEELHQAMGLVDTVQTADLFRRYVDHVNHHVRGERILDKHTGEYVEPDEKLMRDVEDRLGIADAQRSDTRTGTLHRIGAWRMDNPDGDLDYGEIFRRELSQLREAFYLEKRQASDRIKRNLLVYMLEDDPALAPADIEQVEATLESLERDFGYCRDCAIDVIGYLLRAPRTASVAEDEQDESNQDEDA